MVVEFACTCGDLPAHSHVGAWVMQEDGLDRYVVDPYDVRIWVDWKDVAREAIRDTP